MLWWSSRAIPAAVQSSRRSDPAMEMRSPLGPLARMVSVVSVVLPQMARLSRPWTRSAYTPMRQAETSIVRRTFSEGKSPQGGVAVNRDVPVPFTYGPGLGVPVVGFGSTKNSAADTLLFPLSESSQVPVNWLDAPGWDSTDGGFTATPVHSGPTGSPGEFRMMKSSAFLHGPQFPCESTAAT